MRDQTEGQVQENSTPTEGTAVEKAHDAKQKGGCEKRKALDQNTQTKTNLRR